MNRHGPLYCNLCSFGKSSPRIEKAPVRRQKIEKSLTPLNHPNIEPQNILFLLSTLGWAYINFDLICTGAHV